MITRRSQRSASPASGKRTTPLTVHVPTRDEEEIYGVPQSQDPEMHPNSEEDDESSCGSMPALVSRVDDDSSVESDSSWDSIPPLIHRSNIDSDSWSECSWDIDSQASSQSSKGGPKKGLTMEQVVELSNLEAVKQVDISNIYINVPLGMIPVYEDGDGTHVGSLPDLAPDSNDLEEVGDAIEAIAGHKLVRRKRHRIPLLQVIWDNGATSWEPLKHLKKDIPCMVAT